MMIKKFFKLIRATLIGLIWSYVYLILANLLMILVWNFNIFSLSGWQTINYFWENGGVIKKTKDYIFLISLGALLPIWLFLWNRLCKVNYFDILILPISIYNNHIIKKYGQDSKRIVLRNLKPSIKATEEIKVQVDSLKPEAPKEGNLIREAITNKMKTTKN